jgi:cell division protein FtsB
VEIIWHHVAKSVVRVEKLKKDYVKVVDNFMDEQTQKELRELRNAVRFLSEEIASMYRHGFHHLEDARVRQAEYVEDKTRQKLGYH